MIICSGVDVAYTIIPADQIRPGQFIVDKWARWAGSGTLGVAYTRRVLKPVTQQGRHWYLVCRGDYYFGDSPGFGLPVMNPLLRAGT